MWGRGGRFGCRAWKDWNLALEVPRWNREGAMREGEEVTRCSEPL